MNDILSQINEMVIKGDNEAVLALVNDGMKEGISAQDLLDKGLILGMDVVGQKMKTREMFIPEVLRSAQTMQNALEILEEKLAADDSRSKGTIVIGTVEGDLHDIGKNLVAMMLKGGGFTVVDLGINVKPSVFVDAITEHKPKLLGMSALLTTTLPKMSETIDYLVESGNRDMVRIIIGGAPVNQSYCDKIGADGYAANAAAAVEIANSLIA